jgi:exonuclease III
MINIISWNTNKKNTAFLRSALTELASEQAPEIFVFQECLGQYVNTILNPTYDEIPYPGNGINRRVRIFLKKNTFDRFAINTAFNNKLVFVHLRKIGGTEDFNLAGIHFYSKLNTERQQLWKNKPFTERIDLLERTQTNNNRTILIGDFNYNPYDSTLSDPNVFNAIDNKNLIRTFSANPIGNRNHNYWYNPMWNLLGDYDFNRDLHKDSSGTYFLYNEAEIPYWNLIDGALLRPSIMDRIDFKKTEVLTNTSQRNFLKPLIIRTDESLVVEDFSDHLPLKVTLKIN